MFQAIRKRLDRDERGFTLIELMVVVLIIAILIAIAIPTFLGARTKSQDRAAQVLLRQGLLTAKTSYTDNETYLVGATTATTATGYKALEPSVAFVGGAPAAGQEGVMEADATHVVLARQSASGKWFCIQDDTANGTRYGGTTTAIANAAAATAANCVDASF